MNNFTLTDDQDAAYKAFVKFLFSPTEEVFVLEGYAGTGKSTLVSTLLADLPSILKAAKLINKDSKIWDVQLTATTNKAVQALQDATGESDIKTIQSFLGLRVQTEYKNNTKSLAKHKDAKTIYDTLIFIDEGSFMDDHLLKLVLNGVERCKIVIIGDPAQLTAVKCNKAPAFTKNYPKAELTKVVRQQEGNQIIQLATRFRETVKSGEWFQFNPDFDAVHHYSRPEFGRILTDEFMRPDWSHNDSKILAWTNNKVIEYNDYVKGIVQGCPILKLGDYAVVNEFISNKNCLLKTDALVAITSIDPAVEFDMPGWNVELDNKHVAFLPESRVSKIAFLKNLRKNEGGDEEPGDHETKEETLERFERDSLRRDRERARIELLAHVDTHWIDLRAAYACTINKSQGSTYDKVFIDLDDIRKCSNKNQMARMLYVAVSRARHQVIMTGDIL
jgi:hypothetical protein